MRLKDFFRFRDKSKEQKEFPEQGVYRGVPYRIDGDSVMLTSSSGREVQLAPSSETPPSDFDVIKAAVVEGIHDRLPLVVMRPTTFSFDTGGRNLIPGGDESATWPEDMWGISPKELPKLLELGNEILVRWYQSRKLTTS